MAELNIEVPTYVPGGELTFAWNDGFRILLERAGSEVTIKANAAGLVSLARHLLTLAQGSVPVGSHVHLTDSVELEPNSGDLIIDKIED